MNWSKVLIGGLVAGIALNLTEWVLHGVVMANTYKRYPVFTQEAASPLWFLLVAICVAIAAAILFAKTRQCWADGAKGGATFGILLGVFAGLTFFYNPLVYEGYPYYLAWCQGSITVVALAIVGVVLGLVIRKA
ncbi:MAG: hypothetical protein R3325_02685 [Thermoanaerobaculia bacterium]|nr:hypothetical protein [Thermoanaerobaculia bacterium]